MTRSSSILMMTTVVVVLLLVSSFACADVLFGTFTPSTTGQKDEPSIFLAMADWLTENNGPRQAVRIVEIGWRPTKNINYDVGVIADVWRWSAAVPIVTWMPYAYKNWTAPNPNEIICSGAYDDYIDQFLSTLSSLFVHATGVGRRMYLRFAPAPNGNYFPWSPSCPSCGSTGQKIDQSIESYIKMWNYIMKKVFDPKYKLDRNTVQVIFDVNAVDLSAPAEKFYPGSASSSEVDWFGITGDNFGNTLPGNAWVSPQQLLSPMVTRLNALNKRLPIGITSAATTSVPKGTAAKNTWISALFEFAASNEKTKRIKMVSYHNADSATDLACFGGKVGYATWPSPVSNRTYNIYPAYRSSVANAPFVGANVSNPVYITNAQFFGA